MENTAQIIAALATIAAIIAVIKIITLSKNASAVKEKYSRIIDADDYVKNAKKEVEKLISDKTETLKNLESELVNIKISNENNAAKILENKERELKSLETRMEELRRVAANEVKIISAAKNQELTDISKKITEVQSEYLSKTAELESLKKSITLYEESSEIISYGLYDPHFDYDVSEKYKDELLRIRNNQKVLVRNEQAAYGSTTWTVNGSAAEGKKQTKHYIKLMLRAFNGECEALIADVRWNNISKMEERLRKAFDAINKLGETHAISITEEFHQLKLKELWLTHEYQEKLQQEKDDHRRAQEQIREEQQVQKEIEKALKESSDEESRYTKALEQARKDMEKAQGDQLNTIKEKMALLENELAEAKKQKERALSMAQQTKAGHVYIISNIGSFGDNVYKIGMTRRLEPLDRVKELGDASVPFEFDVHAMLFSKDAPALERQLHKVFEKNRLNLVNKRKEFFNVHLDEIEKVATNFEHNVEFTKIAEARDYRKSISIRSENDAANKPQYSGLFKEFA